MLNGGGPQGHRLMHAQSVKPVLSTCSAANFVLSLHHSFLPPCFPTRFVFLFPNIFCSNTSQNAQLRANTLSLQTAWTGFDPNLYSGGSSSAGPALVEIATARSFYTQQGHCD